MDLSAKQMPSVAANLVLENLRSPLDGKQPMSIGTVDITDVIVMAFHIDHLDDDYGRSTFMSRLNELFESPQVEGDLTDTLLEGVESMVEDERAKNALQARNLLVEAGLHVDTYWEVDTQSLAAFSRAFECQWSEVSDVERNESALLSHEPAHRRPAQSDRPGVSSGL